MSEFGRAPYVGLQGLKRPLTANLKARVVAAIFTVPKHARNARGRVPDSLRISLGGFLFHDAKVVYLSGIIFTFSEEATNSHEVDSHTRRPKADGFPALPKARSAAPARPEKNGRGERIGGAPRQSCGLNPHCGLPLLPSSTSGASGMTPLRFKSSLLARPSRSEPYLALYFPFRPRKMVGVRGFEPPASTSRT